MRAAQLGASVVGRRSAAGTWHLGPLHSRGRRPGGASAGRKSQPSRPRRACSMRAWSKPFRQATRPAGRLWRESARRGESLEAWTISRL